MKRHARPRAGVPPWLLRAWPFLAITAATVLAYLPALRAGYIWDDDQYLTNNELLRSFGGLFELWIPGSTPQYYPAVFTSFWLEYRLWGLHPAGYHLVNVLLHAANGVLVWRLGRTLGLPGALFLGAWFALHPVHVESVAWVTERKNVLSGLCYLASALAFLRFDAARSVSPPAAFARQAGRWYALSLLLFALALLAKTVTCSLPAVLMLIRLWQRGPLTWRWFRPLLPMFALGLLLALHTAHLERVHVGAEGPDFAFSFAERLLIASNALLFYPQKLVWPSPLVFIYPRWQLDAADPLQFWPLAVVVVVAMLALVGFLRGHRGPGLLLAFFAGTLFPALGFFNVYPMRYSFVADHFQYLASLGILGLLVGTACRLAQRPAARGSLVLRGTGAVVLLLSAILTFRQSRDYADEETLWLATLARNPSAWIAHNNLATIAARRNEHRRALALLQQALPLASGDGARNQIRYNIALALSNLGRNHEALRLFEELQQSRGGMELRLAQTLDLLGREQDARAMFERALQGGQRGQSLAPFGFHWLRAGEPERAVPLFEELAGIRAEDPSVHMFLADSYAAAGRLPDAIAAAERALALSTAEPEHHGMVASIRSRLQEYRRGRPGRR